LMVAVTVTHPIYASDGHWWARIGDEDFSATVLSFFRPVLLDWDKLPSSAHWPVLLVFFVPVVLAFGFALADRPRLPLSLADALTGCACVLGWLALQHETPRLFSGTGVVGKDWGPAFALLLALAVGLVAVALPYLLHGSPRPVRARDPSGM